MRAVPDPRAAGDRSPYVLAIGYQLAGHLSGSRSRAGSPLTIPARQDDRRRGGRWTKRSRKMREASCSVFVSKLVRSFASNCAAALVTAAADAVSAVEANSTVSCIASGTNSA